jgi:hypothetical protein
VERRRDDCTNGESSPTYLRELLRYGQAAGYVPWWGDTTIWEVDYGQTDDWSRSLANQEHSPNTRRKVLGAFHASLADLRRRGTLDGLAELPTVRAAMKGPCSSAPRDVTKARNWRRIIIDAELREWIERWVNPQGALDASALFVNPTARRPGKRWLSNPLREEWNRAAETVGVRVKMYEGTKHTSATEAVRGGRRMEEIQKAARSQGPSVDREVPEAR